MEMVFDRDPQTGTVQMFHYDEMTDKFTIEDRQDVSAILKTSAAIRSDSDLQASRKDEVRRVALIPMNILFQLRQTWNSLGLSWQERQDALRKFLNDPSFKAFRTDNSRV